MEMIRNKDDKEGELYAELYLKIPWFKLFFKLLLDIAY